MRILSLLLAAPLALAAPLPLAIGTNTGGASKSEGFYLSSFDPETGVIAPVKLGAKCASPNFLAVHPTRPILYAASRTDVAPKGRILAFPLPGAGGEAAGGELKLLGEASSGGLDPCHLAVDASGSTLAVANYNNGVTSTLRLDSEGLPSAPVSTLVEAGKGPNPQRQEGPHAHGVYFFGKRLLVPDLGVDRVVAFELDPATSALQRSAAATWSGTPGAGPRHIAFSPDRRHAYVVNELENTVTACRFDAAKGSLETIDSVPTLPADWQGASTTAEIEVHPSGKFVYASNRGHDSIAVFSRDAATGRLTPIQIAPCGGKVPRHFAIAPGGRWLLCGHQDSNTLRALPLDPATGKLGEPGPATDCPSPICILFLPRR